MPEWGFDYHPGGETIHRWTTIVPAATTFAVLLATAVVASFRNRRKGWLTVAAVIATHTLASAGLLLAVAYYELNITGVFI